MCIARYHPIRYVSRYGTNDTQYVSIRAIQGDDMQIISKNVFTSPAQNPLVLVSGQVDLLALLYVYMYQNVSFLISHHTLS